MSLRTPSGNENGSVSPGSNPTPSPFDGGRRGWGCPFEIKLTPFFILPRQGEGMEGVRRTLTVGSNL